MEILLKLEVILRVLVSSCILFWGTGLILMWTFFPVNDEPSPKSQRILGIIITLLFIYFCGGYLGDWVREAR